MIRPTRTELWAPPRHVAPPLAALARAALALWDDALQPAALGPVERCGTRGHWLAQLALLTMSSRATLGEHLERQAAMAGGLAHPAFCFSRVSLYEAARRFKFFPTFSEVIAFLDEVAAPARCERRRLALVAGHRGPAGGPTALHGQKNRGSEQAQNELGHIGFVRDLDPAARRKFLADMAALRQHLVSVGVACLDRANNCRAAAAARARMDAADERMRARMAPILAAERKAFIEGDAVGDGGEAEEVRGPQDK